MPNFMLSSKCARFFCLEPVLTVQPPKTFWAGPCLQKKGLGGLYHLYVRIER